ncbi:glycosyltransferase family 39 protein [Maricaulis sp.]|uniref:ArnT family glycosyltransferase n=1 Tax=Maricaulis sp. TaxID=1486257 RepID=UPI00263241E3|nr:glycosyltransferase family 39 protein [Maricaulis sp.]
MAELAQGKRAFVIIALIVALSALAGLFTLPPLDRDESRFAQATAQMLETGNFVEINFLDTERNKKPIGIHWLQVVTVGALSDAEAREIWAYRIPSMLGAILAALACFWGGSRLIGREAAFAGSALFAATVLLGIEAGIAKTDAMLAGATTLAMAALANLRADEKAGWKTAMLFWFAIGLGTLIKGPVTPMVAGLAIAALVAWERKLNWLKPLLFIPGPLLAIAMVLPWLVAIQIATEGNFLREALGDDLGPKLVSSHERHGGPIGYHLMLMPLMFFPAILFILPGAGRLVSAIRGEDENLAKAARFLIAWAVPTWLVFEILPTKLPHYVLPAYPALALAAGWGLMEIAKARPWQRWTSWGLYAFAALVFAILIPVAFLIYGNNASWDAVRLSLAGFQSGFSLTAQPETAAVIALVAALFAALAGATLVAERLKPGLLVLILAIASGLAWQIAIRGATVPNAYAMRLADQVRAARDYSETITGIPASEIITASGYTEPSLVFSLGSDTVLGESADVLAFAANRSEPTMVVLDLSRDAEWKQFLTDPFPLPYNQTQPMQEQLDRLEICHTSLASGTNYSRGDETVLAIFFTRCQADAGLTAAPVEETDAGTDTAAPQQSRAVQQRVQATMLALMMMGFGPVETVLAVSDDADFNPEILANTNAQLVSWDAFEADDGTLRPASAPYAVVYDLQAAPARIDGDWRFGGCGAELVGTPEQPELIVVQYNCAE